MNQKAISRCSISVIESCSKLSSSKNLCKLLVYYHALSVFYFSSYMPVQIGASFIPFEASIDPNYLYPMHNIEPDAFVDPPDFIRLRGFICEIHRVVTPDNYILTLHRLVNPLVPNELREQLKPVLIQHGLFTSSFNSLIASDRNRDRPHFDVSDLWRTQSSSEPPSLAERNSNKISNLFDGKLLSSELLDDNDHYVSDSLAILLANSGYDVWLGNIRGSTYSLNHTHLDYRYDVRYWDFSFHEMSIYDLPTMLNYVLTIRNRRSLAYMGHSQGNLIMFILQSLQPGWADRVKPFIAVAPIAFIPDLYFGLPHILLQAFDLKRLNRLLKGQLAPKNPATEMALNMLCRPKLTEPLCDLAFTVMLGNNPLLQNRTTTAMVAHHVPEGTSILNTLHFLQLIKRGTFESFDFGPKENLRRYGTVWNPRYPIERIHSPDIALITARTDTLATVRNCQITRAHLRVRLIDDYEVPEPVFGHSDYLYSRGSGKIVNLRIRSLMDRYKLVP